MKCFLGYYNKSVILTYAGAAAAVAGMGLAFSGKIKEAVLCLIFCGVADLFDGMIARRCKRTDEEKEFGIQIDSLTDMASFALFPPAISFAVGNTGIISVLISAFYVIACITRLGYFNVSTSVGAETKFYTGLPATFASLIVVSAYIIGKITGLFSVIMPAVLLVTGLLFILKIKIAKPRGKAYIFLGLLAIALAVTVGVMK
ncbi:MAG: CDP-alcohol phosphatidyltransferase family protein [Oscillospiraceae bacterium]|nr:CDP-alcohol phosphatidyltransferase family protein [Oscillospiraceae bacterium]